MSSKKKPQLVTCRTCEAIVLAKDLQRHQEEDECVSTVPMVANDCLTGVHCTIEKPEQFLPPDAIGWEKEHSVLMSSQTMEAMNVLARQPVRVIHSEGQFVGIVWPCKELGLLKTATLKGNIAKDSVIKVQKCKNIENISNLTVKLEEPVHENVRQFIEMYLAHSYLQPGITINVRYLGRKIAVTPTESLIEQLNEMSMGDNEDKRILNPSVGYKLNIMTNSNEEGQQEIEQRPNKLTVPGMFNVKQVIQSYIIEPIRKGESACSLLLWGLPGSGKSHVLRQIADLLGSRCLKLTGMEEMIEYGTINGTQRDLIILDLNEIDKENSKGVKVLTDIIENEKTPVLLCVRSSDSLDIGYRVRFPVEVEITVPTQEERLDILRTVAPRFGIQSSDVEEASKTTHGFTGGDLCSLLKASKYAEGSSAIQRIEAARKRIRPTGIRQFILEVPTVTWNDIGGNDELKLDIQQAVIWPQNHPEAYERFGIRPPSGILLYGPPGCSKTLIARALANEAKMNFLSVKGPELFSKWVGDSEKAIRDLFARARQVAPTIVFFDEIDAVGSSRGSDKSSPVSDRVLAQLLTELDGLEKSSRVVLLAATNRPDQLDSALLRPGRLDRAIYVGLPCEKTRRAIIKMTTRKMQLDSENVIDRLVEMTNKYSGAEIVALCQTAAMFAMRLNLESNLVQWQSFEKAFEAVRPRTEDHLLSIYSNFRAGGI